MEPIKRLFKELGGEVYKLIILESLLNAGILFFFLLLLFNFLQWGVVLPFVLSIGFLFWSISYKAKTFQLKAVEEQNPQVKEILRTARDNMNTENMLTLALFNELIEKMKTVSVGYLIDEKKVMTKLFVVGVLAFFSIYIMTADLWDIRFDVDNFLRRPPKPIPPIQLNESNDIYGEIRVAKLGNEVLTIQINPTLSDIDFSKVSDAEKRDLNLNAFPVEVEAASDKASGEDKPKEFKLAKEYNLRIHELGG